MPLKFWGLEGKPRVKGEVSVAQSHGLPFYFSFWALCRRTLPEGRGFLPCPQGVWSCPDLRLCLVLELYLLRRADSLVIPGSVSDTVNPNNSAVGIMREIEVRGIKPEAEQNQQTQGSQGKNEKFDLLPWNRDSMITLCRWSTKWMNLASSVYLNVCNLTRHLLPSWIRFCMFECRCLYFKVRKFGLLQPYRF